jgi:short-subunit dehydrogenase
MSVDRAEHPHITRERYGPWAIVAGASEGIGAAFSRRLAATGIDLVLIARREAPLVALADDISAQYGVETRALSLDLSTVAVEQMLFDATSDLEVGLVVYNAGGDDNGDLQFLDVDPDVWAAMVRRNCLVPMLSAHHYGAHMVERGRGGVLLVSSGAAWAGASRLAPYGATKAFDLVLGEALWAEWREHGVDVLSLVVNATDTPPIRRLMEAHGTELDHLDDPDDVARQGLEHLDDGPTWDVGSADGGGPSPVGALSRRDAVLLYSAGTEGMFGSGG